MEEHYHPQKIEASMQRYWQDNNNFQVVEDINREKFYCLSMLADPSSGLHMGQVRNYTLADVISRYQAVLGKNVLQAMSWNTFGPLRDQMISLGLGYDWSREIIISHPDYYHWQQWFFLRLYKKGLAYRKNAQWFLKITAYAEELLLDLDQFDHWPQQVKVLQRNCIEHLDDWIISQQGDQGVPIPIIYCEQCGTMPVVEKDLPVILPEEVTCPQCQGTAKHETDFFDSLMEASWYYARLTCKKQNKVMLDGRANYWLPVDQYVGDIEHAALPLLYTRFFHKLMRDEGLLNSDEPFTRLLLQGMVLNDNLVDPQSLIEHYGADTIRLFLITAAPPEQNIEWSESGVDEAHHVLKRLWAFAYENKDSILIQNRLPQTNFLGSTHWENTDSAQTEIFRQIYDILEQTKLDYERQQFNFVLPNCIKILNLLSKLSDAQAEQIDIRHIVLHKGLSILLGLLSPIAPHITSQLWQDLNYKTEIKDAGLPRSSPIIFKNAVTGV